MEWTNAKEIAIWMMGTTGVIPKPNTIIKDSAYKFINSGLLIKNSEDNKIDFIPNHRIKQVTITP